ncbi:MAG: hypothetical protein ACJZ80_05895 [Candidatus Puniceispirillales bacterium]
MNRIIKNYLNFRLLIIINIFVCNIVANSAFCSENFILTTVNKIPITKNDVVNRAKLLSFSVENNTNSERLKNYYSQSLNSLIKEKVILSAGLKINENIIKMVSPKADQLLLNEFNNSKVILNKFINKSSIPKAALLDKYNSQLIWSIVLKNKFKKQLISLEKQIENNIKEEKNRKTEDLYDLAEIVISKKNNRVLLNKIKSALNNGVNFLDLAKQISISSSAKLKGKVGWKNYQNLPNYIKSKKIKLNEGDIISFPNKDKIKIIKVLAKRLDGKLSKNEMNVIVAQIRFPINFQKKDEAFNKTKERLESILDGQKGCKNLRILKKQKNKKLSLNISQSRIADLSSRIQNLIKKIKLYKISQPIFIGNHGYTYILCDTKNTKLEKTSLLELKNKIMQKHYLIFSERLLKRLYKEANITSIKKLNS